MTIYGYSRVSTEEQAASGLGLAAQRSAMQAEAERRGWTLEHVTDEGYSAKSLARPGLTDLLERIGRGDTVLVAKLDRLSRSLLDFAGLMDTARREGWSIVALDLGVDTTTPAGEMMASVMASFAQYERRLIGQRTAAALQAKKAAGARLGAPVVLDPATRARIVSERDAGHSLRRIADGLTADGIQTAKGGRWHASTVKAALESHRLDTEAEAARAAS